jgi:hypothetical protein
LSDVEDVCWNFEVVVAKKNVNLFHRATHQHPHNPPAPLSSRDLHITTSCMDTTAIATPLFATPSQLHILTTPTSLTIFPIVRARLISTCRHQIDLRPSPQYKMMYVRRSAAGVARTRLAAASTPPPTTFAAPMSTTTSPSLSSFRSTAASSSSSSSSPLRLASSCLLRQSSSLMSSLSSTTSCASSLNRAMSSSAAAADAADAADENNESLDCYVWGKGFSEQSKMALGTPADALLAPTKLQTLPNDADAQVRSALLKRQGNTLQSKMHKHTQPHIHNLQSINTQTHNTHTQTHTHSRSPHTRALPNDTLRCVRLL